MESRLKNLIILFLLLPFSLFSQIKSDSTQNSLRDSLSVLTKRIEKLEAIVNKKYPDPSESFKNKTIGFEINPGFLMFGNISGGIQLFSIDRTAEISFPFYYYNSNNSSRSYDYSFISGSEVHSVFEMDIQYRKFLNKIQNGLWTGIGLKYTHIDWYSNKYYDDSRYENEDYYGFIFGFGYRTYSSSGFYYGVSSMIGRYFAIGKDDSQSDRIIFNVEFMKLGYAF